ncbi:PilZ domain-containing protein [Dechloromonas sp. XY25]|uniref:PilZ domain-containing protein n=1 Tax=Dechloromonas hankyongensis TaxID=2908002 RepID=A0ABS9JYG9_9RHOO|nr:PilZ domain-containing protein [Dechloromonas hankyongensis]MCG2575953.1 PilZ domain-containing protein [Dechloromonas hankyongensis]
MLDQRRHQRIRFGVPQTIRIGYGGVIGEGVIENLSLSGLMMRTTMSLDISHNIGCEFSVFDSPVIDVPAAVVSRVCDLYGVRFQPGPISQILIEDAINSALTKGQASILSVHELGGRKTMRITGGLSAVLRSDFMHALTRMGVDEIDLEGVTAVEQAGLALCLVATKRHGVAIGAQSSCFAEAWESALAVPGGLERMEAGV